MKLSDLDPCSTEYDFYDEEAKALDELPADAAGLTGLLEYLDQYDSVAGYDKLFSDYSDLLKKMGKYKYFIQQAKGIFDEETIEMFDIDE